MLDFSSLKSNDIEKIQDFFPVDFIGGVDSDYDFVTLNADNLFCLRLVCVSINRIFNVPN